MKISVIIPVYNSREHLHECLDSVLAQTYDDIEVILVNDGSTDDSAAICDGYAKKDARVAVIHKENAGPAAARNAALDIATGEYIMFLDSDDFWLCDALAEDVAAQLKETNADVMTFQRKEYFDEEKRPVYTDGDLPRDKVVNMRNDIAVRTLLGKSSDVFASAMHAKMVKAQLIREHNIRFLDSVFYMEDTYFTAQLIRCAKTYDRYNKVVYAVRRTGRSSLTTQKEAKRKCIQNMLAVFNEILSSGDFSELAESKPLLYNQVLNLLASPYVYALGMAAGALEYCKSKEEKEEIKRDIEKMKQYSFTVKYTGRLPVKLVGFLIAVFGINFAIMALRIFFKIKKRDKLSISPEQ